MEKITKKLAIEIFKNPSNKVYFLGSLPCSLEVARKRIEENKDRIPAIVQANIPRKVEKVTPSYLIWTMGSEIALKNIQCYEEYLQDFPVDGALIIIRSEDYFSMLYLII